MKTLDKAVRATIARTSLPHLKRCDHLQDWPSQELILSGAVACPFCAYADLLNRNAKTVEQMNRLNASNMALQRLAMDLIRTGVDAERLRQINEAQYA